MNVKVNEAEKIVSNIFGEYVKYVAVSSHLSNHFVNLFTVAFPPVRS